MTRLGRTGDGRGRTRTDIAGEVEQSDRNMQEQLEELETGDADVQTVRETLGAMEFGGTSEGNDAVRNAILDAEGTSIEVFDEKDGVLDEIQGETARIQEGLREQTDADERDEQGLEAAGSRIVNEQTVRALDCVKQRFNEDIEFLKSHLEQALSSVAASEAKQQDHRSSVHARS